jgi:hypothetical protein
MSEVTIEGDGNEHNEEEEKEEDIAEDKKANKTTIFSYRVRDTASQNRILFW